MVRLSILIVFFGLILVYFFGPNWSIRTIAQSSKSTPKSSFKYVEYPHSKHADTACSSCHIFPSANWNDLKRAGEPFPDITEYPRHESCLECHKKQFFKGYTPNICSICHTNPSPRDSSRHPFPNPREIFDLSPKGKVAVSDFAISFSHEKHIDIVSRNDDPFRPQNKSSSLFVRARFTRDGEESCKVCHQTYKPQGDSEDEFFTAPPKDLGDSFWLKKGTFKTVQIGHTVCFTCHTADTGIAPAQADCGTCHKLKPTEQAGDFDLTIASKMKISDKILMTAWRKRDSSATFRHEFSMHAEMECATCHNVKTIDTLDAKTKKINVLSCAPCHITATVDDGGVLNAEVGARKKNAGFNCVKCHLSYGRTAIPESHVTAIEAQK